MGSPSTLVTTPQLIKRGYTEKEAAAYIGMSTAFLKKGRTTGNLPDRTPTPEYLKIGRSVRYTKESLDAWLDQFQPRQHTSQGGGQ